MEKEEKIMEWYKELKEYTGKLDDRELSKLVCTFERKFAPYLERKLRNIALDNATRITRPELKELKEDLIKYNKRVLHLSHKDAKRFAEVAAKAFKEGYEE